MPRLLVLFTLCLVWSSCRDSVEVKEDTLEKSSEYSKNLAPLIDPAKLDTLKEKRAATPRLRKACYWLEMARRNGDDLKKTISKAHSLSGNDGPEREAAQSNSLIRNLTILERLGCLNVEGMEKLRRGKAPTITKGRYAGEIATGDHIIPRSVTPELDNCLFNLEFMPLTLNQRKGAKISQRQIQLARRWHSEGLLSYDGLGKVEEAGK